MNAKVATSRIRRILGNLAALALCPLTAYLLFWVIRSFEQFLRGRGFDPFGQYIAVGIISLYSDGYDQWAPITMFVYCIICLTVALPLLALGRFWPAYRRTSLCVAWGGGCGTYFFLLERPFSFNLEWGGYGTVAGIISGFIHYYIAYASSQTKR